VNLRPDGRNIVVHGDEWQQDRRRMCRALPILALLAACTAEPYGAADGDAKPAAAPTRRATSKPTFVPGNAEGEIPPVVARHRQQAEAAGEDVLVYVGATWCEPCQRFHEAVERGELDDRLAGVRFVEYDADRDRDRLAAAGYDGRLIPRFAVPDEDGRFGGRKIEGGIKGEGAVEHIVNRLGPLVSR
jgi:thiol-disulfide isomerase/thioredoxin